MNKNKNNLILNICIILRLAIFILYLNVEHIVIFLNILMSNILPLF